MFPLFDSRYLYLMTDMMYRGMALPSEMFKTAADLLDERGNPDLYRDTPGLAFVQRAAAARFRLLRRLTQSYKKPAFGITETQVDGKPVQVQEETVFETAFCHLVHFKKESAVRQPRLLMIAPMAGHYATLLRDTVRDSLPYFDVYVTDWMNARDVPISHGGFDMDGYIATLVRCFEYLAPDFHIMAICQSGAPAYSAIALLEYNKNLHHMLPQSMTVMGSPIDVRKSPTAVNTFATEHEEDWFEHMSLSIVPEGYAGANRLVYPGFMQLAAFVNMHPERHQKSITDAVRHYEQGDFEGEEKISSFYAEYCAVMDLTAEFYLQTVRVVFKEALLPQGKFVTRGREVNPGAIRRTGILAIEGEHDDICGLGQTKAALDISTGLPDDRKEYVYLEGAGHYGLFNGHRYRETVLPAIRKFTSEMAPKK